MATLTAEQFRKMFPQANNEPVTGALATGLQAIADPLNQYRLPESMPVVGGMSAADFTGLTGAQGVLQDFSRGNLQSGDMRMFDLLGLGAGAAPVARTALKGGGLLGKEALRQMNEGTGLLGKVAIDPRMYAVTKTDYEKAFDLAQQRAALPVTEGGLGLSANNTAMDRAKAMGFDKNVLHGTSSDISNVIVLPKGRRYVQPFYTTADNSKDAAEFASQFANTKAEIGLPRVMPLMIRGNILDTRNNPEALKKLQQVADQSYTELKIGEKGLPTWGQANNYATEAKNSGIDSILLDERVNLNSIANLTPSNIRSRFAAFDPFRRSEADILAGFGVGVPSINFLDKEKPKKKK